MDLGSRGQHQTRSGKRCRNRGRGYPMKPRWALTAFTVVSAICCAICADGCGYRVAGRANTLPPEIHTIAVPALVNKTQRYRIEQRMTGAVIHEFLERTKYRIVSDPTGADAVLHGEI